ncbi:MAG TPA: hypothetical protein VGJ44_22275, partial [Kribbellaceae bacterium]
TPTETPTGTPTETPTGTPSETPSTAPTGTPSTSTAVPSMPTSGQPTVSGSRPAAVPTEVEAGLAGPVAQDDSNHGRTTVGAGLLAAGSIMIGMGSFLALRRRGVHRA